MELVSPGVLGKRLVHETLALQGFVYQSAYLGTPYPTSAVPVKVLRDARLKKAAMAVNQEDALRIFAIDILRENSVVATLVLQPGDREVQNFALDIPFAQGDRLSAQIRLTMGSGRSAFHRGMLRLELEE